MNRRDFFKIIPAFAAGTIGTFDFEIGRLKLNPGEKLIVKLAEPAPDEVLERLGSRFKSLFPNNEIIILDGIDLIIASEG